MPAPSVICSQLTFPRSEDTPGYALAALLECDQVTASPEVLRLRHTPLARPGPARPSTEGTLVSL
ncbi:hypothetical protein AB0C81_09500 [Streptomyces roseoverticillatus]|uniref:hypothetical protein n=1 Tax=Streptomyces roseoverticillatus TaxID=66429 RepID=UPI0033D681BC